MMAKLCLLPILSSPWRRRKADAAMFEMSAGKAQEEEVPVDGAKTAVLEQQMQQVSVLHDERGG